MEDHPTIVEYRAYEAKRLDCMNRHQGVDSPEEDSLLDEADHIWWRLTAEEMTYLRNHHGPSHQGILDWLDKTAGSTS